MNKQKLFGIGRKLLIVLLLASAILLGRESGYFSGLGERLQPAAAAGTKTVSGAESGYAKSADMVQPLAAVVCTPEGGRYGAAYDGEAVPAVFRRFSADLGEALGSAGDPQEISETEFCTEALCTCGVFLRFGCPQPLELLTACLGAELTGPAASQKAELLALRAGDAGVALFCRTEDGICFRCETAVSPEGLRSRTEEYTPNGAYYAFEKEALSGGDACTVLLEGAPAAELAEVSVPLPAAEERDELLEAMGMNSFVASSYTEADGTVVYVDEEATLRLSPSGSLYFRRSSLPGSLTPQKISDAADAAWRAAARSVGRAMGDGMLTFAGATVNEGVRSVTVVLDYMVDGIPVHLREGHAAELVLRDGEIIQAQMNFRRFTRSGEAQTLLPYLQAEAIAAAAGAGAALEYADGGDTLHCIWVKADG